MSNAANASTERKDEFRKYLDRGKVPTTLTKILTDLYEMDVRPENPLEFLYKKLGEQVEDSKSAPSPNVQGKPAS